MNAQRKAQAYALAVKYLGERRTLWIKLHHPRRWPMVTAREVERVIRAEQHRRQEATQ